MSGELDPDRLIEALKDVLDPELGVNIIDLGMVYGVIADEANVVTVDMTLTSPACPLSGLLEAGVRQALLARDGIRDVRVNWVWKPSWGPHRITDDGRDQLRSIGFNV